MRNKFSTLLMILGTALILGALALFLYNQREAAAAGEAAEDLMPRLLEEIGQAEETGPDVPADLLDPAELEMTEVMIDGYGYVGYLSIPTLGLELPVMGSWDYDRLKIAPCRYAGTARGDNLVIMAHNYVRHFGGLRSLSEGDTVTFTDMDGVTHVYAVAALDVLNPTAVEEMTDSGYDLTLFTCTYGGQSRVTVRCDRVTD